jgi:ligand-binding sensor domain-containing protein
MLTSRKSNLNAIVLFVNTLLLVGCTYFSNSIDEAQIKCGISKADVDFGNFIYVKPYNENGTALNRDDVGTVEIDEELSREISPKGCVSVSRNAPRWLRIVTKSREAYYQKIETKKEGILEVRTSSFKDEPTIARICQANEVLTPRIINERLNRLQDDADKRSFRFYANLIPSIRTASKVELKFRPQQFRLVDEIGFMPEDVYQLEAKIELENKDTVVLTEAPCFLSIDRTVPDVQANLQGDILNSNSQESLSLSLAESGKIYYRSLKSPSDQSCACGVSNALCEWVEYQNPIKFGGTGIFYLEYCGIDLAGNISKVHSKQVRIDDEKPKLQANWLGGSSYNSIPRIDTYPSATYTANIAASDNSEKIKVECRVSITDLRGKDLDLVPICNSKSCESQSLVNFQPCSNILDFRVPSIENEVGAFVVRLTVQASDASGNRTEVFLSRLSKKYLGEFLELGKAIPGKIDANIVGEVAGRSWLVSDAGLYSLEADGIVVRSPSTSISDGTYLWKSKHDSMIASRKNEAWIATSDLEWRNLNVSRYTSLPIRSIGISDSSAAIATDTEILLYPLILESEMEASVRKLTTPISEILPYGKGFVIRSKDGRVCWAERDEPESICLNGLNAESLHLGGDRIFLLTNDRTLKELWINSAGVVGSRDVIGEPGVVKKIYSFKDGKLYVWFQNNQLYRLVGSKFVVMADHGIADPGMLWISPQGKVWIYQKDGVLTTDSGELSIKLEKKEIRSITFDDFDRPWIYFSVPGKLLGNMATVMNGHLIEYPEYNYDDVVTTSDSIWIKSSSGLYRRKKLDYVLLDLDKTKSISLAAENSRGLWFFGEGFANLVSDQGINSFPLDGLSPRYVKSAGDSIFVYGYSTTSALVKGQRVEVLTPPTEAKHCSFVGESLWCKGYLHHERKWKDAKADGCDWIGTTVDSIYFNCRTHIVSMNQSGTRVSRFELKTPLQDVVGLKQLPASNDFWFGGSQAEGGSIVGVVSDGQLREYNANFSSHSDQTIVHKTNRGIYVQDGRALYKLIGSKFAKTLDYRQSEAAALPGAELPYAYLRQDKYERLLIQGDDDTIHIYSSEKWSKFSVLAKDSFIKPSSDDWFEGKSVALSPAGNFWLWSQERVAYLDDKDWKIMNSRGLPLDTYVSPSILFDRKGCAWIPNRLEESYSVFNPTTGTSDTVKFSPSILTAYSMYQDKVGNLWQMSQTGVKAIHLETDADLEHEGCR